MATKDLKTLTREEVAKVLQLRAGVENLKLGPGVLDKLSAEGERASLRCVFLCLSFLPFTQTLTPTAHRRYALQLLAPAAILASLAGRAQIEAEDVGEMGELFLDAKSSARVIGADGGYDPGAAF